MGCSPSMLINHRNNRNKDNGNLFSEDTLDPQPGDSDTKEKNHVCDYVHESIQVVKQKVCHSPIPIVSNQSYFGLVVFDSAQVYLVDQICNFSHSCFAPILLKSQWKLMLKALYSIDKLKKGI